MADVKKIADYVMLLSEELKKREWKIATAESCTGGGLAYWLTSLSGSSEWFERGFITYSNLSKEELLTVNAAILNQFGSVSEPTACAMAEGALKQSQAQISVAITGIAGPGGGSQDKPVGLVWIAVASVNAKTVAVKNIFNSNRSAIRNQSIATALKIVIEFIQT